MKALSIVLIGVGLVACNDHQKAPDDKPLSAAVPKPVAAAPTTPIISGIIKIDEPLKDKVPNGSTLFIVARPEGAIAGPPALVKKIAGVTFPYNFVLESDNVMMGGPIPDRLSVTARLDQDGDAMSRSPGDLLGKSAAVVDKGATGVEVLLVEVVPAQP